MTPEVAAKIRQLHEVYPDLTQQQIAERMGVVAGRVSETLAGKRK
jgi:plasmid maintenance system antidote protein VapI